MLDVVNPFCLRLSALEYSDVVFAHLHLVVQHNLCNLCLHISTWSCSTTCTTCATCTICATCACISQSGSGTARRVSVTSTTAALFRFSRNNIIFGTFSCLWLCRSKALHQGRIPLPNWMNLWKNSKRPLPPPPHFWKIILQIYYNGYTLNPKITFLFINFMLKNPCLKLPKSTI